MEWYQWLIIFVVVVATLVIGIRSIIRECMR